MKYKWKTIALIGLFTTQVHATLIFDDGALHTIDGVVIDDVMLSNGSDLIVDGFAFIQPTIGEPAIIRSNLSSGGSSQMNVSGNATVMGEILYRLWVNDEDSVTVDGNALIVGQGEVSSGLGRSAVAGMRRVEVSGNARLLGAHNAVNGGTAIDNRSSGSLFASVSGGEIIGGNGGETGGDGMNGWVDPIYLDMTAGTIQGGTGGIDGGHGIEAPGEISGTIAGGEIIGGNGGDTGGNAIDSYLEAELDITGGAFQGGHGGASGGDALRLLSGLFDTSSVTISGGSFDAGNGLFDDGWLLHLIGSGVNVDITGGLFGYENTGSGLGIFGGSNVNVYGWDLDITDGLLTGYLMDSNWIETPVSLAFLDYTLGTINLFNTTSPDPGTSVPEPSTLLLMAAGIVGLGVAKRKRIT
ncbi:MAG: PEP-CTERM sorting domain-containing protein [Candidatus Thiodiazotropha sp.]